MGWISFPSLRRPERRPNGLNLPGACHVPMNAKEKPRARNADPLVHPSGFQAGFVFLRPKNKARIKYREAAGC